MPVVEFSQTFGTNAANRMLQLASAGIGAASSTLSRAAQVGLLCSSGTSNFGSTGNTFFYIMKGTVPTDFSTLVNFNARSADVLVTFTTGSNAAQDFSPAVTTTNPATITTNYVAATASGTATWFWWTQRQNNGGSYNGTDALIHQIIGTVGTISSGADLEIPDTNIVSGVAYRVSNLRLQFPISWIY